MTDTEIKIDMFNELVGTVEEDYGGDKKMWREDFAVFLFGWNACIEYTAQQSVHPTKGGLTLRACVNSECGWIGKESACLTYKHAGDERLCPHCNDNTESVSLSALRG